jgi:hypothetical protein
MQSVLTLALMLPMVVWAGAPEGNDKEAPVYRVTVIQRSFPAVNYGHRSAPTRIDFRGTVLAPEARGGATVEAKPGAVIIRAKFEGLVSPAKFGTQYLTYVLWAISPEGQAARLGEIITNHRDNAKLEVTTSLQTFGLLVTAEPYFAVSKPGPVVVVENILRQDTVEESEPILVNYELLQRPENYEVTLRPAAQPEAVKDQMVSQKDYEALLALYQARNSIQIAKAEGVDIYAHDTLQRAEALTQQAQKIWDGKVNRERVVMLARQATQTAEDARNIAAKKSGTQMSTASSSRP